jgi:hypothetical protein
MSAHITRQRGREREGELWKCKITPQRDVKRNGKLTLERELQNVSAGHYMKQAWKRAHNGMALAHLLKIRVTCFILLLFMLLFRYKC